MLDDDTRPEWAPVRLLARIGNPIAGSGSDSDPVSAIGKLQCAPVRASVARRSLNGLAIVFQTPRQAEERAACLCGGAMSVEQWPDRDVAPHMDGRSCSRARIQARRLDGLVQRFRTPYRIFSSGARLSVTRAGRMSDWFSSRQI